MTENVRKLVGVAVMAVLVVVGVAVSSGDDTDFTRNRSFSSRPSTSASADKAADCCDETLALLGSMQTQLTQISSQLQTHLLEESEASTTGASPDVQEIADQMAEYCSINGLPENFGDIRQGGACPTAYLAGFPLELARQVVLAEGTFGVFHRFNYDLDNKPQYGHNFIWGLVTSEACGPINYGYNPPPRVAIAIDTHQGLVVPYNYELNKVHGTVAFFQDLELLMELYGDVPSNPEASFANIHWPTVIEEKQLC